MFFLAWALFMQDGLALTPGQAALGFVVASAGEMGGAWLAMHLVGRHGRRAPQSGALLAAFTLAGYAWLIEAQGSTLPWALAVAPMVAVGLGLGMVGAALADLTPAGSASASAVPTDASSSRHATTRSEKDLVNLTTGTPEQGRARARWAEERGARFLDAGIMAVPTMIGQPASGGYVFYSGDRALFEEHVATLAVPAATSYVGEDAGHAALHDVALLSATTGMFAGITHAFALMRPEKGFAPGEFAPLLSGWLGSMAGAIDGMAAQLESGDYTEGVVSNLAMMTAGDATLVDTARRQGVSTELLAPFTELMAPFTELMAARLAQGGHDDEGVAGLVGLRRRGD
ncbi:NAD(P)-dependent oxidoreductase [Streptomyces iconiensis]|uniref:NAD(P)-dependent oxidoreductase n=1 Tax=Streptomyces iconiensis TaxID=1384038 RepID=A0ABT6ZUY8_9ACTN|nr:NAD(P)-dependent oxidoreductase [Streptomyces iconiensis]MDJ1132865.1 NAD(P)-dependent oxidoreductase [Streptomyces iconiensis]